MREDRLDEVRYRVIAQVWRDVAYPELALGIRRIPVPAGGKLRSGPFRPGEMFLIYGFGLCTSDVVQREKQVARRGSLRIKLRGAAELPYRGFDLPHTEQAAAQLFVRAGVVRREAQRRFEACLCVERPLELAQGRAERRMPARARRVELHRAAKMLDGFLPPARLDLQRAEVEPGLRKPSIGGDGFAIVALGLPVRAPGLQNHPEIGERFRVSRIDREQLAAADFGFVEPSGFQVLHGKAVQAIQYHPRMTLLRRLLPLLTLTIAACATLPERTYVNPVIDRDFPDPAVLRAPDGWFYAYATQSESNGRMLNIQVARSRDLVQWALLGDALPGKPRWAATRQEFWAPLESQRVIPVIALAARGNHVCCSTFIGLILE